MLKDLLSITKLRDISLPNKIWFINAPYAGHLLFNGEPTSLLYAISPTIEAIKRNEINNLSLNEVALLNPKFPFTFIKEHLNKQIKKQNLRVVGISTTTASCNEARKIAELIKSYDKNIIIIFGGPHEDDLDDFEKSALIDDFKDIIDFSIAGDGEYMLLSLIKTIFEHNIFSPIDLKNFIIRDQKYFERVNGTGGLYFQFDNKKKIITYNNFLNVNDLPILPRELLCEEDSKSFDIFSTRGHSVKTAQIITERGCPWNCIFCSESTKAGKNIELIPSTENFITSRRRSVDSVINEIKIALDFSNYCKNNYNLDRQDYKAIFFDDSTFTHKFGNRREYLNILLNELKVLRERFSFEWGCQTRIDQLDEKILTDLIEAGCTYIYIGLESVNDKALKQMAKGMTRKQIESSFEIIEWVNKNYNNILRIGLSLVFGIQNIKDNKIVDDISTVDETLGFIDKLNQKNLISLVSINTAVYYPATLMTKNSAIKFDFHYRNGIPNNEYPWNRFEEGLGYHTVNFTKEIADYIIKKSNYLFGDILVNQDIYNIPEISKVYWENEHNNNIVYLNHASIMKPEKEVSNFAKNITIENDPKIIEKTREKLKILLECNFLSQIVFARNTSEACSLAIWLISQLNQKILKVLLTDIENYSILKVIKEYSDHANIEGRYRWASYPTIGREYYKFIPNHRTTRNLIYNYIRTNGDLNKLENLILNSAQETQPDVIIISQVERTTGRITKLKGLINELKKINPSMSIIVDGAKAFGAIAKIEIEDLGADFYLAGPHFTLGSYPVGILYLTKNTFTRIKKMGLKSPDPNLIPILHGMFSDELKLKNVSENLNFSDIGSLYEAITVLEEKGLISNVDFTRLNNIRKELKEYFIKKLSKEIRDVIILSPLNENYVNFICSFTIKDLDLYNITYEMWLKYQICLSYISKYNLIRVSFNYTNTFEEIDYLINSLKELVNEKYLRYNNNAKYS